MCLFKPPLRQTESVAGEEHDHRVTSRINLVDLAGSERCGPAGSSGQQLRVSAAPQREGTPSQGIRFRRLQTKYTFKKISLYLQLKDWIAGVQRERALLFG